MNRMDDEKIQQWLESNKQATLQTSAGDATDLEAYEWLFQNLKKQPPVIIPYEFAAVVTREAKLRYCRRSDHDFYIVIGSLCLSGLVLGVVSLFMISPQTGKLLMDHAVHFKWIYLFIIAFFCFIQWLDEKGKQGMIKKVLKNACNC